MVITMILHSTDSTTPENTGHLDGTRNYYVTEGGELVTD